jgi:hypothetical protein
MDATTIWMLVMATVLVAVVAGTAEEGLRHRRTATRFERELRSWTEPPSPRMRAVHRPGLARLVAVSVRRSRLTERPPIR